MTTFKELDSMTRRIMQTKDFDQLGEAMRATLPDLVEELRDSLKDDPILHRFVRRKIGSPINKAWEALGEQRAMAFTLAMMYDVPINPTDDEVDYYGMILCLLEAIPYYWTTETTSVAINTKVPPHTVTRDLFPYPFMYWTFQDALVNKHPARLLDRIDAILFLDREDRMSIYDFGSKNGSFVVSVADLYYGTEYKGESHSLGQILAMLSFINSPYVITDKQRLTRAERHEQARSKTRHHKHEEVSIIILRRPQKTTASHNDGGEREWNCRWMVDGHIRNQYYRKTRTHKPIWIAPYMKGPNDKPLKQKVYVVKR